MALVTKIKAKQIKFANGLEDSSGSLAPKPDTTTGVTVVALNVAANGLGTLIDNSTIEHNSNTLRLKDDGVTGAKLHADVAGVGLKQDASGNLDVDLNEQPAGAVAVANDSLVFMDADDGNATKKESIADFVAAIAGAGLIGNGGQLDISGDSLLDISKYGGKKANGSAQEIFRGTPAEHGAVTDAAHASLSRELTNNASVMMLEIGPHTGSGIDCLVFKSISDGPLTSASYGQLFLNGVLQDVEIIPDAQSMRIKRNQHDNSVDVIHRAVHNGKDSVYNEFVSGHIDALYLNGLNTIDTRYFIMRAADLEDGDFITIMD